MLEKLRISSSLGRNRVLEHMGSAGDLSAAIAPVIKNQQFAVYGYLPRGLSADRLARFNEGGLLYGTGESPAEQSDKLLQDEMIDHLKDSNLNYIFCENPLAHPNDPWIRKDRTTKICIFRNSVIHYIDSTDIGLVKDFLTECLAAIPESIFFLSRNPRYQEGQILGLKDISHIKENIAKIAVRGEYDGESSLITSHLQKKYIYRVR